jgi:Ca2+-binding RTX toxin-like protein
MSWIRTQAVRHAVLGAGAMAALALPAPALAAKASVADGTLTITAAPGERNDAGIQLTDAGDLLLFDNRVKPTAGAGCRVVRGNAVCAAQGITAIAVSLGNRNDSLSVEASTPAITYSGGAGFDALYYGGAVKGAVNVSIDGLANDGRNAAADNIGADVEDLDGTPEADTLTAGAASALLDGGDSADVMTGGSGNDRIKAAYVEDTGIELGAFYALGRDTVTCGAGNDQVFADRNDTIAGDCEVIGLRTGPERYTYTGGPGNDRIQVDEFLDATVHGGAGNDVVTFPGQGNGIIFGDAGNDVLSSSSATDHFRGGAGNDTIRARDGSADSISCGAGRDTVKADKQDKVARDCEKVSRRRR